jgi:hypothetical protein
MTHLPNILSAILIAPTDNVAVVLRDFPAGETLALDARHIACAQAIPAGHKVALEPIAGGQSVLKCGVPVGIARRDIAAGEHVHIHNVASRYITDH